MWKWTRRDENKSAPPIPSTVSPARSTPSRESVQTVPRLQSVESLGSDVSHIGKSIVIKGDVSGDGNQYGFERAELKKSATVVGDIYTPRIAIEDGAFLEGSVWVHKDTPRPRTKKTIRELLEA